MGDSAVVRGVSVVGASSILGAISMSRGRCSGIFTGAFALAWAFAFAGTFAFAGAWACALAWVPADCE